MPDWLVPCHISGIWKHQITRKMVLLFKCFGLIPSSRPASTQEHYAWACALTPCHGSERQVFHWQQLFFFRKTETARTSRLIVTHPIHKSVTDLRKKGTPTLCCNFTQPPSAFIWSVTGEIIHQPQLLCDPLIRFLSLTLFLCRHKELKGERLSFLVMLLWEGGYCCDCRDNRKKCSWILHLCIHFFKNDCQQVIKEQRAQQDDSVPLTKVFSCSWST